MTTHESRSDLLAPAVLLEFSDDLRYEDIEPLRTFLEGRLAELVAGQEEGGEAHFAAVRLLDITVSDCVHLADLLTEWEPVVLARMQEQCGHVQTLRQNIAEWWNRLTLTAQRFSGHPGYRPRWRPLCHMCVAHAEFLDSAGGGMSRNGYEGTSAHP
ncbi:hypothetical protein [Streptomyces sp. BE147]|uniref:hypothetical protein n=1 Tax=unclassified Streptomyces TaxID=2593676 RepID=UPI002E76A75C|nr:hypothetical protein [Streptomyces sp. BE147]MEE1740331.1 hypothetical protein [Streptomyces sp. BE147]